MTERSKQRISKWSPTAIAMIALAGSVIAWAGSNPFSPASISTRITALETHREHDARDLAEINKKVDFLIDRLVK